MSFVSKAFTVLKPPGVSGGSPLKKEEAVNHDLSGQKR
jgi:hypothetical protein